MKLNSILQGAIRHNYAFWICLIVSITLLITSFLIPPLGIVEPSVLAAVGELFAFGALGALISGIDRGLDARVTHNNTSLEIGDFSKDKEDCRDSEGSQY